MSYIITMQYPYHHLEISLSHNSLMIETTIISKIQAVGQIIPAMQKLLNNHNLTLSDLACIGVNIGPGPFNTLRALIATANGLAFAQKIPLVACNGLEIMLQDCSHKNSIVILDAYGNDIYFYIKNSNEQGYDSIANLINKLNHLKFECPIFFYGNGITKHKEFIQKNLKVQAEFNEQLSFASSQTLINETYTKYQNGQISTQIYPLYFSSPVIKS